MEPSFIQIAMSDGYRLSCRHWQPVGSAPRAFVVALHGIQSHGGWYDRSSRALCEAGYDLLFVDRRGSGRNFSRRGDAPHAERLINDVMQVLTFVRQQRDRLASDVPIILQAVSWGGKLAAIVAARRPDLLDGVALLYPGICARVQPTAWQSFRLSLARKLDIRHRRIAIPLSDPTLFTGQLQWQEFIRQDRLALREVTVGFLLAHQDLTHEAITAASRIQRPVLLMLAGKDDIIDNGATKRWRQQLGTNDVTLHEYSDARHTLEFEPHPEQFIGDLLTWLKRVVTQARS
jgi:alpha-beta hydrolase superfamily lysophospholipase